MEIVKKNVFYQINIFTHLLGMLHFHAKVIVTIQISVQNMY